MPASASRPLLLVCLTFIAMSATMAMLILIARAPMGEPGSTAILKVLLLSGAVILAWQEIARRALDGVIRTYAFAPLVALLVLFAPLVSVAGPQVADPLLYLVLGAIWVVGLRSLIVGLREAPLWTTLAAIVLGAALGLLYLLVLNGKIYATVFSPEQTLFGLQHRDTLFHAAVAAMLAKFGAVSTGLDGLVTFNYHAFSHAMIGLIGRWAGVAPIHAYYLVPQILQVPLLLFSLSVATFWLCRSSVNLSSALLPVLAALLLLFVSDVWDWTSYLYSESYNLALVLVLLSLPLVVEAIEQPNGGADVWRFLILAAIGLAISFTKNSVAAVFACGVSYALVRARGISVINVLKFGVPAFAIVALGVWTTLSSASTAVSVRLLTPLHFVRTYPDGFWPIMIAILLMIVVAGPTWLAAKGTRAVIVEALLAFAGASAAAGLILGLTSGGAYYFMNVGVWVAIAFGGGMVICPLLLRTNRPAVAAGGLALSCLVVLVLGPALRENGSGLAALLQKMSHASAVPAPQTGIAALRAVITPFDTSFRSRFADAARASPGGRMRDALRRLGTLASRDTALHVPPANAAFWNLAALCTGSPFFAPAVAATPMLLGLPPDRDKCPIPPETGYGYDSYGDRSRAIAVNDAELCARAREKRYARVIVLDDPQSARLLDCN